MKGFYWVGLWFVVDNGFVVSAQFLFCSVCLVRTVLK